MLDPGYLPLTQAQFDFWEEYQFHSGEPVSTVAHCVELEGDVDDEALARAIVCMSREAEALHLRFHLPAGAEVPVQCVDPGLVPELSRIDLSGEPDPEAAAWARMEADLARPIDLTAGPLSAQWLIRTGPRRWLWYSRGHHIVLDGYAMGQLERRCAELYAAFRRGRTETGEPFLPFANHIAEDRNYRASPRFERDRNFWCDILDAGPDLPVLKKGGEDYTAAGRETEAELPDALARDLWARADETGTGWPDILTAAAGAYLLHHLPEAAAKRRLPLWLPFMGRLGSVNAAIPALVVNILPVFLDTVPGESFVTFLGRTAPALRRMRRHGRYRVEQLAADRGIGAGSRYFFSPLVNVLPFEDVRFEGCRTRRRVLSNGPADGFNLTFRARADGSALSLRLDADAAVTSQTEFDAHAARLPAFLTALLAPGGPHRPMERLLADGAAELTLAALRV